MELTPICGPWNPCQHKNLNRRDKVQRKVCLQTLHEVDNRARKAGGKLPPPTGRQGIRASSRAVKRKKAQHQTDSDSDSSDEDELDGQPAAVSVR
jgi:hypothetical protein